MDINYLSIVPFEILLNIFKYTRIKSLIPFRCVSSTYTDILSKDNEYVWKILVSNLSSLASDREVISWYRIYVNISFKQSIEGGDLGLVKFLVEREWVLVGECNIEFYMIKAMKNKHIDVVKYLIGKGFIYDSLLCEASECGYLDIVKMVLETLRRWYPIYHGLRCAYIGCHYDIAEFLMSELEKKNMLHTCSMSQLLIEQSRGGNLKSVQHLVNKGADICINDCDCLITASEEGNIEIVKYLLDIGANIHTQNNSALINASVKGHLETIQYLIQHGADIHARNDKALREASAFGYLDIVKYLVSQGADIHAKNNRALTLAMDNEWWDVADYLTSLQ